MWEGGCRVPAFITGHSVNATGVSEALVLVIMIIMIIKIIMIIVNKSEKILQ